MIAVAIIDGQKAGYSPARGFHRFQMLSHLLLWYNTKNGGSKNGKRRQDERDEGIRRGGGEV